MDPGNISWHVLLLHGGPSSRAVSAASFRADRGRDAAMLLALLCVGGLFSLSITYRSRSALITLSIGSPMRRNSSSTISCRTRAARPNSLSVPLPFARLANGPSSAQDPDTSVSSTSPDLVDCARTYGVYIILERRVGHFIPAGVPIMRVLEFRPRNAGTRGGALVCLRYRSRSHDAARC